jgi:putative ABC transport system permease protein
MKLLRMCLVTALRGLARNRMRSALTILGIVIGVGAVITTVGVAQGAARAVEAEIQGLGRNLLFVVPSAPTGGGRGTGGLGGAAALTVADAEAIQREVFDVQQITYVRTKPTTVVYDGTSHTTTVHGITSEYEEIGGFELDYGSFFDDRDTATGARVVVLGATVAKRLFRPGEDPIGARIRVQDVSFKVVGVFKPKGQGTFGNDNDNLMFVPFRSVERRLLGADVPGLVTSIIVSMTSPDRLTAVTQEITEVLRQRHRLAESDPSDFRVGSQEEVAAMARVTMGVMGSVLLSLASVSLLVGGIGIMNILLVSVTERTREIGIRMAVGARPRHILMQFLAESALLSAMGGVVGTLVGAVGSYGISQLFGWPFVVSPLAALLAVLFSAAVGIFFGYYPASRAARLDPITSLRYE